MSAARPPEGARAPFIPKVLVTKIGFDGHDRGSRIVAAAEAGCTHGEICHTLRREMGFGDVQAIV